MFGLVDHRDGQQHITLFDERIGPKNTDHTISIIQGYIDKVTELHPWIRRVLLFLDNAANTNKNRYLFSWGMELCACLQCKCAVHYSLLRVLCILDIVVHTGSDALFLPEVMNTKRMCKWCMLCIKYSL